MAATVLNGSGSSGYTNSTGKNVRVIINIMTSLTNGSSQTITLFIGGISYSIGNNREGGGAGTTFSIGKNVAGVSQYENYLTGALSTAQQNIQGSATNLVSNNGDPLYFGAGVPVEFMLPNGGGFSWQCGNYNMVVIEES